jgi:hypothetical protein
LHQFLTLVTNQTPQDGCFKVAINIEIHPQRDSATVAAVAAVAANRVPCVCVIMHVIQQGRETFFDLKQRASFKGWLFPSEFRRFKALIRLEYSSITDTDSRK